MEQLKTEAEEFNDSESKFSFVEVNEIQINDEVNTLEFDNSDVRNELKGWKQLVREDGVESEQQVCSFRELKNGLEEKLTSGVYILVDRYKADSRQRIQSPGWSKFYCVVHAASKKPVGFGKCKKCGVFIRCSMSNTTGLLRHDTDKCGSPREIQSSNSIRQCDKNKVKEAQILMCVEGGHPFSTVEGCGFLSLSQTLINVGAKYGQINVQDVLCGPTEISKAVSDMADDLKIKIIPEVKNAIAGKKCAFTIDMWPDRYNNVHYIALAAHYMDSWNLQNVLLCYSPFPDIPEAREDIFVGILEQMAEIDISLEHLKPLKFVADSDGSMTKALESFQHLDCMAHVISSILRHTFDEQFLRRELPAIQESIDASKVVITYFKRKGFVCRLRNALILQCSIQWNSLIDMLESVHSQIDDVIKILDEENASKKLDGYNHGIVEALIKFFGIFREASKNMENDNEPTLQLVILWFYQLQNNCIPEGGDTQEIVILKKRALTFLKEKYKITLLHKIATFLVPKYRSLKKLSEEERIEVHNAVKKMCLETECTSVTQCEDVSPPPQKNGRFDDWCDDESQVTNEVDHYLYSKLVTPKSNDILQWWKTQSLNYPQLSHVAEQVLCIPATSSLFDKCFKSAAHIFSERRCNLDVFSQSDLLFVCQNKTH